MTVLEVCERPISRWFCFGRKQIYQENNEAIRIARNITIGSKPYHMQYRSTLQCISLTLHCKYPTKSLWDQCRLVSEEVKKTTESKEQ